MTSPTKTDPATDPVRVWAHVRNQFMLGDCVHLAHALALLNPGWGVLVVGDAEEWECGDGTGETYWETDTIQHAWAVRPDGALVDIEGVHPVEVAETLAAARGLGVHRHGTAEEADRVWGATLMDLAGSLDPTEVAAEVMQHWGHAPVGTRCTLVEGDPDADLDED